ncbi:hypothetical protein HDU67_004542, partial [Dinochytrium kinnereticum]
PRAPKGDQPPKSSGNSGKRVAQAYDNGLPATYQVGTFSRRRLEANTKSATGLQSSIELFFAYAGTSVAFTPSNLLKLSKHYNTFGDSQAPEISSLDSVAVAVAKGEQLFETASAPQKKLYRQAVATQKLVDASIAEEKTLQLTHRKFLRILPIAVAAESDSIAANAAFEASDKEKVIPAKTVVTPEAYVSPFAKSPISLTYADAVRSLKVPQFNFAALRNAESDLRDIDADHQIAAIRVLHGRIRFYDIEFERPLDIVNLAVKDKSRRKAFARLHLIYLEKRTAFHRHLLASLREFATEHEFAYDSAFLKKELAQLTDEDLLDA